MGGLVDYVPSSLTTSAPDVGLGIGPGFPPQGNLSPHSEILTSARKPTGAPLSAGRMKMELEVGDKPLALSNSLKFTTLTHSSSRDDV